MYPPTREPKTQVGRRSGLGSGLAIRNQSRASLLPVINAWINACMMYVRFGTSLRAAAMRQRPYLGARQRADRNARKG
jgi:hypothetical protein